MKKSKPKKPDTESGNESKTDIPENSPVSDEPFTEGFEEAARDPNEARKQSLLNAISDFYQAEAKRKGIRYD